MGTSPFTLLAIGLDTLPLAGRLLLLAVLLSCALYGFLRVLSAERGSALAVLYCKGALLALVAVPAAVFLLGLRVPVPVEEMIRVPVSWPTYVTQSLMAVWAAGLVYHGWVAWRDLQTTLRAAQALPEVPPGLQQRAQHWQQRLNLHHDLQIRLGGPEQAWHVSPPGAGREDTVVVPAAALNWPAGLQDVLLLVQLAQLHQRAWRWLLFARLVQVLYWPLPWVGRLCRAFAQHLHEPAQRLAQAAYRDPEGWRRDVRQLQQRAAALTAIPVSAAGQLLRLPSSADFAQTTAQRPPLPLALAGAGEIEFKQRWSQVKRHKREKDRDPHEQAYWLIAVSSILIGVATTLTQVPASPEFEPGPLKIKWQDQMLPRLRDFHQLEAPTEGGEGSDTP